MLKIYYHPSLLKSPILVADGEAENLVREFWDIAKHSSQILITANELVVLAARVLVVEGVIPHDQLELHWITKYEKGVVEETQLLPVNKDGQIEHWPNGFCDTFEKLLARVCKWGVDNEPKP